MSNTRQRTRIGNLQNILLFKPAGPWRRRFYAPVVINLQSGVMSKIKKCETNSLNNLFTACLCSEPELADQTKRWREKRKFQNKDRFIPASEKMLAEFRPGSC